MDLDASVKDQDIVQVDSMIFIIQEFYMFWCSITVTKGTTVLH